MQCRPRSGTVDPLFAMPLYFLSDGEPSAGDTTDPVGRDGYDTFVASNNIDSYSVGVRAPASPTHSFSTTITRGCRRQRYPDPAIIVPDLNELDSALLSTVPAAFGGNLVAGSNAGNVLGRGRRLRANHHADAG